jgi:hypothetical protein
MLLCDYVVDITKEQKERLSELEKTARMVVEHMVSRFPHSVEWRMLKKWWNGRILAGSDDNIATFNTDSGCLVIGIPKDGGKFEVLNASLLLALSKGASSGKACTHLHDSILKEASLRLGIRFELSCAAILEYGMIDTWGKNVPCHRSRISWPELIDLPVDQVVHAFTASGYKVETATWDTMYGKPPEGGIIRIIYDARSLRVVSPAPHVGTLPPPEQDDQCFLKADKDSSITCIGAPLSYPPKEWGKYVGMFFTDVVDSLRFTYPHATIESLPSTAGVSRDARRDRIRVRFDPITARVVSIPMIG